MSITSRLSNSAWAVPLGNEFAVVPEKDAYAILETAWSVGVRYYDVSPWYGLGLAERRYGSFLHNKKRSEYVISSKVGKLLKASKTAKGSELFPFSALPKRRNLRLHVLRSKALDRG